MNIKILVSLALTFLLLSTSIASDLYVSQKNGLGFIGTSDSCVVVSFVNGRMYAPNKPVKRDIAAKQYVWKTRTSAEQAGCNEIKQAATQVKVWKVAVNPRYPNNRTRPVKNVVDFGAGVLGKTIKNLRADIGLTCGKLIKAINKRYQYRYIAIGKNRYAVVCE